MLRYSSPVVNFRRTVMEDTEIRGQPVRAGDKVVMFYGSGNRDGDVFDDPDRFDVGRHPNPHIAFGGGGPHLCLGMHVARIEIAVMLRELLTRLPNLAPAGTPERLASNFIAGVRTMPVSWALSALDRCRHRSIVHHTPSPAMHSLFEAVREGRRSGSLGSTSSCGRRHGGGAPTRSTPMATCSAPAHT